MRPARAEKISIRIGIEGHDDASREQCEYTHVWVQNGGTQYTNTPRTTRYLRSSVLAGAEVAEVDEGGVKRKGHVYAGGEKLAEHELGAGADVVTWRLMDAARGGWVEADAGRAAVRRELDALGADVGATNPYATTAEPSYAEVMERDPVYGERGNALDIRGGCTMDGLAASCSEVRRRVEAGTAAAEVTDGAGHRTQLGSDDIFFGAGGKISIATQWWEEFSSSSNSQILEDGEDSDHSFGQVRTSSQIERLSPAR